MNVNVQSEEQWTCCFQPMREFAERRRVSPDHQVNGQSPGAV